MVPEPAERRGVSRSAVSRQLQEASAEALRGLCERRFDDVDLVVIYLDGKHFGGKHLYWAGPLLTRSSICLATRPGRVSGTVSTR